MTRGPKHTFVGIDINFRGDGTVMLSMDQYIKECINLYHEEVVKMSSTPAKGTLFNTDEGEEMTPLTELEAEKFHHTVAKLLYAAKRTRIDIDLAVSFLCTRVASLTKGDKIKLIRVFEYLKSCPSLLRTIMTKGELEMHTWVDTLYVTHQDMRGHTGGASSMVRGMVFHGSTKQKLNTKSSTESEVVGVSDYIPHTIWAKYFLAEQGYNLSRDIFYQDNTSAIKMITGGKKSCSGMSRHIHIRYFFIKDVIEREKMTVKYCPIKQMIADYFTKPVQGMQFYEVRNIIMGTDDSLLAKECVERKPGADLEKERTDKEIVTSNDGEKVKNADKMKKEKKPMTDDVVP